MPRAISRKEDQRKKVVARRLGVTPHVHPKGLFLVFFGVSPMQLVGLSLLLQVA